VLKYCREFHCLPSQLFAEDAELLRLVAIERHGLTEQEEVSTDGQ
jgi:hypothetical protein